MDTWHLDCLIESIILHQNRSNHQSRCSRDSSPPTGTTCKDNFAIFPGYDDRCHGTQWSLPGFDKICRTWRNAKEIGQIGRWEIVHFIVENDASFLADHFTAQSRVNGRCERADLSVLVDHTHVRSASIFDNFKSWLVVVKVLSFIEYFVIKISGIFVGSQIVDQFGKVIRLKVSISEQWSFSVILEVL